MYGSQIRRDHGGLTSTPSLQDMIIPAHTVLASIEPTPTHLAAESGSRHLIRMDNIAVRDHSRGAWPTSPRNIPDVQYRTMLRRLIHSIPQPVKLLIIRLLRVLGFSPMRSVCREISRRGFPLSQSRALEVFGKDGRFHTLDYSKYVKSLEIWELNPRYEPDLRNLFPEAAVRIVDSYDQVKESRNRFDLIVIDNPLCNYGPDGRYVEHFDLFPDIWRICSDSVVFIVNVIPSVDSDVLQVWPNLYNARHLERRREFYGTAQPDVIPIEDMVATYAAGARREGFDIRWHFDRRRTAPPFYYLVFHATRA